jgi:hypothetical protein
MEHGITAVASPIPDNLLLNNPKNQRLYHCEIRIPHVSQPKKDLVIFLDNSRSSQYYLPFVRPAVVKFLKEESPRCNLVDVLTFNTGVSNLLFNDGVKDAEKVNSVLWSEEEAIDPAEIFLTLNHYIDSKLERNVTTRTTIIIITFAMTVQPGGELLSLLSMFNRKAGMLPVDVHVVGFGGHQPASMLNLLSLSGSTQGSYQGCCLDFEPEKLTMEMQLQMKREKHGDINSENSTADKIVKKFRKSISEECVKALDVVSRYISMADCIYRVGNDEKSLIPMMAKCVDEYDIVNVVLLSGERIIVKMDVVGTGDAGTGDAGTGDAGTGDAGTGDAESGAAGTGREAVSVIPAPVSFSDAFLRHYVLSSVRVIVNNIEKYSQNAKFKDILKNLLANKKNGVYYQMANDGEFQSCLRALESLILTQIAGEDLKTVDYASLATQCARLLSENVKNICVLLSSRENTGTSHAGCSKDN